MPESICTVPIQGWKLALSQSFRDERTLLKFCGLDSNRPDAGSEAGFPLRVTRYYASLIEKGNAKDPLLLQVLPDLREHQRIDGYKLDAVGDLQAMKVPGLIHKYPSRALLTLTGACPIHCRYCFRRHFPYSDANVDIKPHSPLMNYLSEHREINEVILSGGEPLMLSDEKLSALIDHLNQIPHIGYLRIHSRLLSVLPERVNAAFIKLFSTFRGRLIFITHINHPNEISEHNRSAFQQLSRHGFSLFNQSVLLKGVNDDPHSLVTLSHRLFDSGIVPYYLHTLDKVHGSAHFDLDQQTICSLYTELQHRLPGYLVPKLVHELAGRLSKTQVQCGP